MKQNDFIKVVQRATPKAERLYKSSVESYSKINVDRLYKSRVENFEEESRTTL